MTDWTAQESRTCSERRALVLAHPDLAKRLTERPLSYSRPENWTGYVPPLQWRGEHNDSVHRRALVAIVEAAEARENGE